MSRGPTVTATLSDGWIVLTRADTLVPQITKWAFQPQLTSPSRSYMSLKLTWRLKRFILVSARKPISPASFMESHDLRFDGLKKTRSFLATTASRSSRRSRPTDTPSSSEAWPHNETLETIPALLRTRWAAQSDTLRSTGGQLQPCFAKSTIKLGRTLTAWFGPLTATHPSRNTACCTAK